MKLSLVTSSASFACAFVFASLVPLVACSDASLDSAAPAADNVEADQVEIVKGIADGKRDPAVVALDIGGEALCSASLVAPDVVLTARHCVAHTSEQVECPAAPNAKPQVGALRPASSFTVLVGDDIKTATAVAHGKKVFTTPGATLCDEDVALIVLDHEVAGITPLDVSRVGIAQGKTVRAVGYGKSSDTGNAGVKLLRDHVKVLSTTAHEFSVGESTCQGDSGGPAIDDSTGEIVGVVSRGGPECDGKDAHNIYTRADAFVALVDQAIEAAPSSKSADAGTKGARDAGHKMTPLPTDLGGACQTGADCASGVCITVGSAKYCSQACSVSDHCPSVYQCLATRNDATVCALR